MTSQAYPRPITSVHQIEPISACNLRCVYCPSKDLEEIRNQPKMNMGLDVFERALHWCKHFEAQGTQGELSLTGIGETLMHPQWREMVRMAREALPGNYLNFSTNGILLDDAACEHLARYGFRVWVSLHRPEKAGPAMNRAARHGILDGPNASAAISLVRLGRRGGLGGDRARVPVRVAAAGLGERARGRADVDVLPGRGGAGRRRHGLG
jgi:MoaA/NifB/PqqE/SkfB family radical SAM enzyme